MTAAVGVVGLGPMGSGMAERLAARGHRVVGFDIDETVWLRLRGSGVDRAISVEDVAAACESMLIVVNTDMAMLEIVSQSSLTAASLSAIVVMGTHSPQACRRAEAMANDYGVHLVDAPVSGGRERALAGTLSVLSSGSPDALAAVRWLLNDLGDRLFDLGPVGSGQGVKLINNLLTTVNLMAVAEAWALAEHLNLDLQQMTEAVMGSSGASRRLDETASRLLSGADLSGSRAGLKVLAKDLELALSSAPSLRLPLVTQTRALVVEAVEAGLSDKDIESVVPWTVARVRQFGADEEASHDD